jgi:hypothetical protein
MNDKSDGRDKRFGKDHQAKHGDRSRSESTYRLNNKRNSSVEIYFGAAGPLNVPLRRNRPPSDPQPAVGQRIQPGCCQFGFLVLSGDSTMNNYKHYIAGARLAGFIGQGFGWS